MEQRPDDHTSRKRVATRAIHVEVPGLSGARPLSVPIYQTSGFAFDDPDKFSDGLRLPQGPFAYTRLSNPTVRALENVVADLEGGVAATAASSGMGAINAVLLASLRSGDHVVAQRQLYGGTLATFQDLAARFGVEVSAISGQDAEELRAALRPNTVLVYLETIANPVTRVSDLPALVPVAKEAGAMVVVDNTFATPMLCRPIEHGADVVVHSTTKYFGGHADVTGGIAVFADLERYEQVWRHTSELGTAADPFAAWLVLRGIQTLPLRMPAHCKNAEILAKRLAEHGAVSRVYWPGLEQHPDHEIARRILLDGFGGMLAFDVAAGREAGRRVISSLTVAALAPSLGGTETLVLHPASTSHRQLDDEALAAAGIGQGTIRVSVGLEDPDDLWDDFAAALAKA